MKNKIIALLIAGISISFLFSCHTYLSPALSGNNIGYLPRPLVADSVHSMTNISGSYAASLSPGKSVSYEMGMLNISRGHSYKFLNFAYGAFGYIGFADYNWHEEPVNPHNFPNFQKTFTGFGLRSSIGFHDTSESGNNDFRFINWENTFSTESGEYADFRKNIYNNHEIFSNTNPSNKTNLWTTGLSTEIAWKGRRNKNLRQAFRLFYGGTLGLASSFKREADPSDARGSNSISSAIFSINYYLTYKRFSFDYQLSTNINTALKLSLGYRL